MRVEPPLDLDLAQAVGQIERRGETLGGGNVGEQRVDVGRADARQHLGAVDGVERQIAHRGSREGLEEGVVVGLAQQRGELARVGELDLEDPAAAHRVLVDQPRLRVDVRC